MNDSGRSGSMGAGHSASVDELRRAALAFREGLRSTDRQHLSVGLREFPVGSCGDVVLILGAYLADAGFGQFQYVWGQRGTAEAGTWCTHAWLEQRGVVVDITADQFQEVDEPIVATTTTDWHAQWRAEVRGVADYRLHESRTRPTLHADYLAVCACIDRLSSEGAL